MKKVFLDSSIFFSACRSKSGGASNILMRCRKKEIQGYISTHVIFEIKKPTHLLSQKEKQRLNFLVLQFKLEIVQEPTVKEVKNATKYIKRKDAPILAAAIKSKVEYLITLDRRDFMKQTVKDYSKPTNHFKVLKSAKIYRSWI
ncbi:putative toxin-antitoxin system toxin component, PIN family [Candidatus Roizmanbacteria bacterium RIFCSPLOWO2_01_FULL_38_12]|uniref:Putative toxin-antitoxin system toxin component, PIN family n=1 Tax=Candidatus Roizmanbacteria bacterium RIFCSPLOWO2_01_FULL_38_12 TaxID=1802061 RepID=A0A1F7IYQ6_9BACT|nr:MAG: putative toxin-antitoxin system toxin component, PIN family [Candidatus Roizmanbacteria bacterium RIFCSPLOWO2_01_FULL_38_12]